MFPTTVKLNILIRFDGWLFVGEMLQERVYYRVFDNKLTGEMGGGSHAFIGLVTTLYVEWEVGCWRKSVTKRGWLVQGKVNPQEKIRRTFVCTDNDWEGLSIG